MRPFAFTQSKPVRSLGFIANDVIARGCAGKILAVVSNAVYLQTDDGEILWLARDAVPMHARGVIYAYDENTLRVGMRFSADDALLRLGERVTIELRAARVWRPRAIATADTAPRALVRSRVSVIARSILSKATLYAAESKDHDDTISQSQVGDCLAKLARNDIVTIAEQSKALIGWGAGLTPAGDDFVGGMLFALHHLRAAYALTWDTQPLDDLLNWARSQTNIISYTILRDLAHGIGVEPLHDLWCALLARDAPDNAAECATRLARIGNSTGAEMLAGVLTGIQWFAD